MTDDSSPPSDDLADDSWDLDDEDLQLGESVTPNPVVIPGGKEEPEPIAPIEEEPGPEDPEFASPVSSQAPSETERSEPVPEEKEQRRQSITSDEASSPDRPSTSLFEKISISIVLACILGLLGWGLKTYLAEAPEGELIEFTEDYPAEGKAVSIAGVETWWRVPVREGDNPDVGVRVETQLIPCASITLASGNSTTLQVSFQNGRGDPVGDTVNLEVKNGAFVKNGSKEIEIHATAGFTNAPDLHPYIHGDIDPWSLIIVEQDSPDQSIVKARVGTNLLEKE